jgi:CO/xanthine dehydrogenase FAD-binding subunit
LYSFKPKVFVKPKSEDELVQALKKYGKKGRILAGGTGIYELSNRGLLSDVEALIDITSLQLSYIKLEGNLIHLGAVTTLAEIQSSDILADSSLIALMEAARAVQPLQVKNVATIAGSLCSALPFFDIPVALFSLDAEVVVGPSSRKINSYEFIKGYFEVSLGDEEYVREIVIEKKNNSASAFLKFSLTSDDWAIVNCSVSIELEDERIINANLFFGGAFGEKVAKAHETGSKLAGLSYKNMNEIDMVIESNLKKDLKPETDIKATSEYRMQIAKVMCKRALKIAFERVRNRWQRE